MAEFTISKSSPDWEIAKQRVYDLAYAMGGTDSEGKFTLLGKAYADSRVAEIFSGDSVSSGQLAQVLDQNGNKTIEMSDLAEPWDGSWGCATYNWEDFVVKPYDSSQPGRDPMFEYYCIRQPQEKFNAFAKFFSERGANVMDHVTSWQDYQYRSHGANPQDSRDVGNNLPLLLGNYEPVTSYFAQRSQPQK